MVAVEEPLCRACLAAGRIRPGEHTDHIVPIAENADLRLVRENLQRLCKPCHSAKTRLEQRGK